MTITDPGSSFFAGLLIGSVAVGIFVAIGALFGWKSRTFVACIASVLAGVVGYFLLFSAPEVATAGPSLGSVAMRAATGIWLFLYAVGWLAGTGAAAFISEKYFP